MKDALAYQNYNDEMRAFSNSDLVCCLVSNYSTSDLVNHCLMKIRKIDI